MLTIGVPSVDDAASAWQRSGGSVIVGPGRTRAEQPVSAIVKDPAGLVLELVESPARSGVANVWIDTDLFRETADFFMECFFLRTLLVEHEAGAPHVLHLGHTRHPDQTGVCLQTNGETMTAIPIS